MIRSTKRQRRAAHRAEMIARSSRQARREAAVPAVKPRRPTRF